MPRSHSLETDNGVGELVRKLNSQWSLQLPERIHTNVKKVSRQKSSLVGLDVGEQCVLDLMSLANLSSSLDKILLEFEDGAKSLFSEWVWKPSQEKGSMASWSRLKDSRLLQDIQSSPFQLTEEHRRDLLNRLAQIISDEIKLHEASASYSRHSPPKLAVAGQSYGSVTDMAKPMKKLVDTKKRSSSAATNDNNPNKQRRINDIFPRQQPNVAVPLVASLQTSFESTNSPEPQRVFSPVPFDNVSSCDTSIASIDLKGDSQDLFPSQDVKTFVNDPSFNASFQQLENNSTVPRVVEQLYSSGPFAAPTKNLPMSIPFAYRYELHRAAMHMEMDVLDFWKEVKKRSGLHPSYDELWMSIRAIAKKLLPTGPAPPEKGWKKAYDIALNHRFQDNVQTITFSGELETTSPNKGFFSFRLKPMVLDKGCRLHRRYGADRFMVISLPFEDSSRDKSISSHGLGQWLSNYTHTICGRQWRVYFAEGEKKKTKDRPKRLKVYLFAVNGVDFDLPTSDTAPDYSWRAGRKHRPISIAELIKWHLRPMNKLNSTDLKTFSRFALGLSKTTPTIELQPSEFLELKDPPKPKAVMNDGCAMMSLALAQAIQEQLGLSELPTAFQGRIGGAKGLWMVDYHDSHPGISNRGFWIEVSDSQLKILPHPSRVDGGGDVEQRTFEVLTFSTTAKQAYLNPQYINILVDRKVDKSLLRQALQKDVNSYTKAYTDAQNSNVSTMSWLFTHHRPGRSADSIEHVGAFPRSTEDQIQTLLESGFDNTSSPLADKLKALLTTTLDKYVERLHIKVEHSTSFFCVADPYHVLAPGEVFLNFSTPRENPVTKLKQCCIYDIDVLVGRNPAQLPSDMQKVRAVFRKELMNFTDVAVFSSQGDVPLASLLSGGDYDGDTVFVCWDPAFVKPFVNAEPPAAISPEACGLQCEAKPLNQIFHRCRASQGAFDRDCDEFLRKCVTFSLKPSLLGECVLEHEKVIYHERAKLHEAGAVLLANMAGHLVDAPKQGYSLSKKEWYIIRREVAGEKTLYPPAYRSENAPLKATNVIDWLKFIVATNERDQALRNTRLKLDAHHQDQDLVTVCRLAHELARDNVDFKNILNMLREKLRALGTRYSIATSSARSKPDQRGDSEFDTAKWHGAIARLHEDFKAITPASTSTSTEMSITQTMLNFGPCAWNQLRASCLYELYWDGTVAWYMAGHDLCQMKAGAVPGFISSDDCTDARPDEA